MNDSLDVRLRDDPGCPSDLRSSLADWADEWPDAAQLSALRESIREHVASEEGLPRLRSPASGTSAQLRGALENDVEELPTATEMAELRQRLNASLRVSIVTEHRFVRRKKRPWRRTLLVAALIALPAAAAAFVGYQVVVSRRAAPLIPRSLPKSESPPRRPARGGLLATSTPSADPTAASSQFVSAPRPKASVTVPKPPNEALDEKEYELIGRARERMNTSPAEALTLLGRHARLFPAGVLVQERELIAIESLVRLGRDAEARARAQRFAARYPGSAHLPRLKRLLDPGGLSFGF